MNSAITTQKEKSTPAAEPWEVQTVQRQFPQFSEQQIKSALEDCKREMGDGTAREKMMNCVASKLR
jgi:hypothetical protein